MIAKINLVRVIIDKRIDGKIRGIMREQKSCRSTKTNQSKV